MMKKVTLHTFETFDTRLNEVKVEDPPHGLYSFNDEEHSNLPVVDTYEDLSIKQDTEGWNTMFFIDENGSCVAQCSLDEDTFEKPILAGIEVNPKFLRQGIGYKVHEYLIKKFGGIYSDTIMSNAAISTWKKLANNYDVLPCYDHTGIPVANTSFDDVLNSDELILLVTPR